jgi:hypothetical protein
MMLKYQSNKWERVARLNLSQAYPQGKHAKALLSLGACHTLLLLTLLSTGCGPEGSEHQVEKGRWSLEGTVSHKEYVNGEVVAFRSDGASYSSRLVGPKFVIDLPESDNYALYFVKNNSVKSALGNANGGTLEHATFVFEGDEHDRKLQNLLRLPQNSNQDQIDLGEITIKREAAYPANNPAETFDFDGDNIVDYRDLDDNSDNVLDSLEKENPVPIDICHTTGPSNVALSIPLVNIMRHKAHGDYVGPCQVSRKPNLSNLSQPAQNFQRPAAPAPAQPAASTTPTTPAATAPAAPAAPAADKGGDKGHDHHGDDDRDRGRDRRDREDKDDEDEDEVKDRDGDDDQASKNHAKKDKKNKKKKKKGGKRKHDGEKSSDADKDGKKRPVKKPKKPKKKPPQASGFEDGYEDDETLAY